MNLKSLIILAFLSFSLQYSFGQSRIQLADETIQSAITDLLRNYRTDQQTLNELSDLLEVSNQLFERIFDDDGFNEAKEDIYIQSLDEIGNTLVQLNAPSIPQGFRRTTLNSLNKDLELKLKARALAAQSSVLSTVIVVVNTYKADKLVNGYEVRANTMWDINRDEPKIVFDNPTNDSKKPLAPGYYVIWIERNGEIIQKRSNIEVGDDNETTERIIFRL